MAHCRRCGEPVTGPVCDACSYPAGIVATPNGQGEPAARESSGGAATRTVASAPLARAVPSRYPATEMMSVPGPATTGSVRPTSGTPDSGPNASLPLPAYTPPPAQPPPAGWNKRRFLILYSIALVFLAAGFGYVMVRDGLIEVPGISPSTPSVQKSSAAPSPSPPPTVDANAKALEELQAQYKVGKAAFTADGHWIVQLASKWNGLTTDDGKTYELKDIEAEHQRLKDKFGDSVILLQSTDFGKQYVFEKKPEDEPIWVTVFDPGTFQSVEQGNAWCRASFPSLTGDDLIDVCYPRQAVAAHD